MSLAKVQAARIAKEQEKQVDSLKHVAQGEVDK